MDKFNSASRSVAAVDEAASPFCAINASNIGRVASLLLASTFIVVASLRSKQLHNSANRVAIASPHS